MHKVVMTFGTFDGFHPGHRYFLKEAKKLGTYLIVVVAQDLTTNLLKDRFPKFPLSQRISAIEKTGLADLVIGGDMILGQWLALSSYEPDLIALGYDQLELGKSLPGKWKKKVRRLKAYEPEIYKSSILNKNMTEKQEKVLNNFTQIYSKKGKCTIAQLSRKMRRTNSTISEHLMRLQGLGKLKWSPEGYSPAKKK